MSDVNLQGVEPEPEFEGTISNVTFPAGREALLTCSVKNLGRYKVGWLRASDQTVLALQGRVVTHNNRISVVHEDMHTWRLRIKQIRESDKGCYMCQINSSPMKKQIGCIDVQDATLGAFSSAYIFTRFFPHFLLSSDNTPVYQSL
uniref:Uncharacterized protein n=1 Tax=Phlebotomus papatasi TaxID=29031 RepID=A0A1B0CYR1_PHLPP